MLTHKLVDLPDTFDMIVIAWDASFKGTAGSDRCVGDVWAKAKADEFLLDEDCGTYEFLDFVKHVQTLYERHKEAHYVLIEDTANGPAAISILRKRIPCLLPVKAKGSKTSRASISDDPSQSVSFLAACEAGHCYLPHPSLAKWVLDYVEEFSTFPKGKHDDRVDSSVHGHNKLSAGSARVGTPDDDEIEDIEAELAAELAAEEPSSSNEEQD
jgi:predicted phage terminase large subunit-like protein